MARLAPVWKCQNTLYSSSGDACAVASYALCWYAEFADDTNTAVWVDCSSRLLNCNLLSALRLAIVQRAGGCLVYLPGNWLKSLGSALLYLCRPLVFITGKTAIWPKPSTTSIKRSDSQLCNARMVVLSTCPLAIGLKVWALRFFTCAAL